MKRLHVDLDRLAAWDNLSLALWKAAKGKRQRPDVIRFLADHEANLTKLRHRILQGELPLERYRYFQIKAPKPRKIIAVSFELRVVHHAIMNLIGINLEQSQINNSFACLPGRGVHVAVKQVQRGLRRGQWCVKIDIEKYFEHVDHPLLKKKLVRRFKSRRFLKLLGAIIDSYSEQSGKGLPIGSLTSQYFANFYLECCDRFIEQLAETMGYVRYVGFDSRCSPEQRWLRHNRPWVTVWQKKPFVAVVPGSTTAGTCDLPTATTGISATTTTAFVLPKLVLPPDGASEPDGILLWRYCLRHAKSKVAGV